MGTAGSVEMKIKDELDEITDKRLIKKHTSQPQNILPGARPKKTDGVKQSQSLSSIDVGGSPILQLPVTKENELKLAKEQELQALLNKNKKLDTENGRLRAELQALNRLCQKVRAERDTATDSCHDATHRAISLEQDREKIQRQFKIFRETKESEIQALLQEKRNLEAKLHRMEAHGVATGDDHKFRTNNVEIMKEQSLIPPDLPTPPNHWWGAAESETTSLFGSFAQISNAVVQESNGSITELKNDSEHVLSNANWQISNSNYFESTGMLPDYTDPEYTDRNHLRCYVTGTPDCSGEIAAILESDGLKELKDRCQMNGCSLSVFSLAGITTCSKDLPENHSIPSDEILKHAIEISDLVIFVIGQEDGRFTDVEYQFLNEDTVRKKLPVSYLLREISKATNSTILSQMHKDIKKSTQNIKIFKNSEEAVSASLIELRRMARLELGVDVGETLASNDEVGCVGDLLLDDNLEQEQRIVASMKDNNIKPVGFQKYYEKLDDFVSSLGPTPPLLISGGCGSGKTTLIKSWVERLRTMQQNFLVFHHYVTSRESSTADPVMAMRRLLHQIFGHLPPYVVPPSFVLSSYDSNHLRASLPKWLDRLSTMNNKQLIFAIDSVDMIHDAKNHFKWLLDPLPVGLRVIISVNVSGCPKAWTQWPTIHLEPLSATCVRTLLGDVFELKKACSLKSLENEIVTHCRRADTSSPLYVSLLTKILCSTCNSDKKKTLLQCCLKTHGCTELYRVILKHIEEECVDAHLQKILNLILKLLLCSRAGIDESEITRILPELSWETWMRVRIMLVQLGVVMDRAGSVQISNSLIFAILYEKLIDRKATKLCNSLLIKHITKTSSPKYGRTAELLPWLLCNAERKSDLRQCLLEPYIFHNLYTSGRAGEIIQYWQYVGEDKLGIIEQYKELLVSLNSVKSTGTESSAGLFSKHCDTNLDSLMIANAYESVGRFLRDLCVMDTAVTCMERSMEIRQSELDPDHHLVADSLHYLGTVYTKWKKYAMAEPLFRHSLELVECVIGREHPRIIEELQSLTFVVRKQEQHEKADLIAKQISALQDRNGGRLFTTAQFLRLRKRTAQLEELAMEEESIGIASMMNNLGVLCYVQKNYSSAESFLKKSLDMRIKLLGESDEDVAQCLHNLSAVYNEQKHYTGAMECMKKSLKIRKGVFGKHNPVVLSTARHLAILCKKSKQFESARLVYEELLEISEDVHGDDSLAAATAMVNLAVVESQLKNHEAALPLYERALSIYENRRGPSSKEVAATLRNIAILRYDGEDYEEAAALYKKSMAIKEQLKTRAAKPWS